MKDHQSVQVTELPVCDLCAEPAYADANIGLGWANVCQNHFNQFGASLGLGQGQRFEVAK